jgi:hypothetical protein
MNIFNQCIGIFVTLVATVEMDVTNFLKVNLYIKKEKWDLSCSSNFLKILTLVSLEGNLGLPSYANSNLVLVVSRRKCGV